MTTWNGMYDGNWNGMITPEAFAHPAKYARGLIEEIYCYLIREGHLSAGSVVVDPFGGIGTGGIVGAYKGIQWIGCELEPKFVALAKANFKLHRRRWQSLGVPMPKIVRGDSRKLRKSLGKALADCVVSSPPYAEVIVNVEKEGAALGSQVRRNGIASSKGTSSDRYGATSGQLGNLPAGTVADVILSSPPYAESLTGDNTAKETASESTAKRRTAGGSLGASCRHAGYGGPENLGNLKAGEVADAIVSSPPFSSPDCQPISSRKEYGGQTVRKNYAADGLKPEDNYGSTKGQVGAMEGETFWSAARLIVQECFAILREGGIAVWVCKDFIRKGKRVPFSDDWQRLCEACGFVLVERIQASLVKEDSHPSLFGGNDVKITERKSFFRRLAEKKGSPRIDHEDVIVMRKAGGMGGAASAIVSSPPFTERQPPSNARPGEEVELKRMIVDTYGSTSGQLGSMKPGSVDEVI